MANKALDQPVWLALSQLLVLADAKRSHLQNNTESVIGSQMQFTRRTLLVLTTMCGLLLSIGIGLWRLSNFIEESVLNSYRLVTAGELFLEYKRSTGIWPSNWEALKQHAAANGTQLFACDDFEDLKNNIHIDFSADLDLVDTSSDWSDSNPQIRIIASKTGQTRGATFDPNELVYSELRRESKKMQTKPRTPVAGLAFHHIKINPSDCVVAAVTR